MTPAEWMPPGALVEPSLDEQALLAPIAEPFPETLGEAAYDGVAGDFIRLAAPETEADPVAILLTVLVKFGNACGHGAFALASDTRHYPNEFICLTGKTSEGRKGDSERVTRRLFRLVDEAWASERVQSGLSSGEGVTWAVRDERVKPEAIRDKDRKVIGYQDVIEDAGISDKRLLAYEPEMASVFRVCVRDGNTLSTTLRQAWDGDDLGTLT